MAKEKQSANPVAKEEVKKEGKKNRRFLLKNLRFRIIYIEGKRLLTGVNEVTEAELEVMQRAKWYQDCLKLKHIAWVPGNGPEDSAPQAAPEKKGDYILSSQPEEEAVKIVKDTGDLDLLKNWSNRETRPAVANAIKERIEKLISPPSDDDDTSDPVLDDNAEA